MANKLIEALVSDVERHIAEKLLPALRSAIVEQLGKPSEGKWSLEIDANDAQTVNFHYPPALASSEYESMAYITPQAAEEKLLDYPELFAAPIVRNGKQATVGYCPEIWQTWE